MRKTRPPFAFFYGLPEALTSLCKAVLKSEVGWRALPLLVLLLALAFFLLVGNTMPVIMPFVYALF